MDTNIYKNATFYIGDLHGYDRIEVSDVTWRFEKYAQYPNAARVEYTIRGKRKRKTAMITKIPLIILDGWDHPDPPSKFTSLTQLSQGVNMKTTRRNACDPEWENEFEAFLYGYLAGSKTKVLIDFRKYDPNFVQKEVSSGEK